MRPRGRMIRLCRSGFLPSFLSLYPFVFRSGVSAEKRVGGADCVVGLARVFLHATDESALKMVGMDDLRKFAAEGEAGNSETLAQSPSTRPGATIKETHQ